MNQIDIYLALGSNLGDRKQHLRQGIADLKAAGFQTTQVSPLYETPALLPEDAPNHWNLPFLNLVVEGNFAGAPEDLLCKIKEIEKNHGRDDPQHWSPRPLDIDILLWGDLQLNSANLTIPHSQMLQRAFVLAPLAALTSGKLLPNGDTVLTACRRLTQIPPLWMGVMNITPDSFSDDGLYQNDSSVLETVGNWIDEGVHWIDLGGQSTRPGAQLLDAEAEWQRIAPILEQLVDRYADDPLRPKWSIDTFHPLVAERALSLGADIINDVSGLTNQKMIDCVAAANCDVVAMHQLGLPADRLSTLLDQDPMDAIEQWAEEQLERWDSLNLDLQRIILDPGIGFGKNARQSLSILQRIETLKAYGMRLLIGHSRKSFMTLFSNNPASERDWETLGASLALCQKGVDILRIHNVVAHCSAYRAWSHINVAI